MSEVVILSDESEDFVDSEVNPQNNRKLVDKMLKLCQNRKDFPVKYINDIDKMYEKCSDKGKNSTSLCNLLLKGIKYIPLHSENSFQYVADVYNELLQLSKKDSTNLQMANCIASTSSSMANDCGQSGNNDEIIKINKIFQELIEKSYENPKYPDSVIKEVDKLYKSLSPEFVQSKYFIAMLKEANSKIWPDSSISFFVHLEFIQEQLIQFKTSMEAQSNNLTSSEKTEKNSKKFIQLEKLKIALKKVRKKIKDLDEAEMDVDNDDEFDENSPYVLKDKYEKRALEIYKKMCKLNKEPDFLEAPPLRFNQTKNKLVNKAIEKYYNSSKTFPDYFEVFTLLKVLNEKKKLNWTETELNNFAHDAFVKLGKQLKILRLNEYFGRLADIATDQDPADENPQLKMELDKSKIKMNADLCALNKKFIEKQKNVEETDGSCLENTDCEISSEDDSDKKTNLLLAKRKRLLSSESDDDNLPKKSQKTNYMKSFDLSPCVVLEKLDNVEKGTTDDLNKVPNLAIIEDNDICSSKQVTNATSKNIKNYENLECNNLLDEGSIINLEKDVYTINGDNMHISGNANEAITKTPQKNEAHKVKSTENDLNSNALTIDLEDNEPIVTEPAFLRHEDKIPSKDVIEINELDDSDVEITESNISNDTVQIKNSLEAMINTKNFDKTYKSGQQCVQTSNLSTSNCTQTSGAPYQQLNNPKLHVNNMVNRWIMDSTQPQRPNMPIRQPNHLGVNMLPMTRMQSFQKSSTQTSRQVTQRFLNSSFQQQRNNPSILSQRVTTMTTTTTVRQIVQQQSSVPNQQRMDSVDYHGQRPVCVKKNNDKKPELIELD